jgi:hypothetical protein
MIQIHLLDGAPVSGAQVSYARAAYQVRDRLTHVLCVVPGALKRLGDEDHVDAVPSGRFNSTIEMPHQGKVAKTIKFLVGS